MTDPACTSARFNRLPFICMATFCFFIFGGADGGCDPFPTPTDPTPSCESDSDCNDDEYCELVTTCTDCPEESDALSSGDFIRKVRKKKVKSASDTVADPSAPSTDYEAEETSPRDECDAACETVGTCQPRETNPGCYSDNDCPDGTQCNADDICLSPPSDGEGDDVLTVCYGECVPVDTCDDGGPVLCDMEPPVCDDGLVAAVKDGCYECVEPDTCEPPASECAIEDCGPALGAPSYQCEDGTWGGATGRCILYDNQECGWEIIDCEPCTSGDCTPDLTCANVDCAPGYECEMIYPPCAAGSDDCDPVPQCLPVNNGQCDDDSNEICEMVPPTCDDHLILAIQNDCYACVDPVTCEPPPPALTCDNVLCMEGTHCVMQDVDCVQAPCPPVPVCVEDDNQGCYSDAECPDDSFCNAADICLPPPGCEPGQACPAVCYGYCEEERRCDDGSEVMCDMVPPVCEDGLVQAVQDGCYACVKPDTCEEPEPSITCANILCQEGYECVMQDVACAQEPCDPLPECVPVAPPCGDDSELVCDMLPPDCDDSQEVAIIDGCFECVPAGYCDEPHPPSCDTVSCPEGSECVLQDVDCVQEPCYPQPICVETTPTCNDGSDVVCEMVPPDCDDSQELAIIDGCYECVPAGSCGEPTNPTCDNVDCEEGYQCEMQDVVCVQAPCPPVPVCVETKQACAWDGDCADNQQCIVGDDICLPPPDCTGDVCEAVCYGYCADLTSTTND